MADIGNEYENGFDEFLNDTEINSLKSDLRKYIITDLKTKLDTEKQTAMEAINSYWSGDDFKAYETGVETINNNCKAALDTLGTEIDTFIEQQATDWNSAVSLRVAEIQEKLK